MQQKDWDAFHQMGSPLAQYITSALDEAGTVNHRLCYAPTARRVNLGISFVQNVQQSPEIRILIEGDLAS